MRKKSQLKRESKFCYIVLAFLSLICIIPILLVVSTSFTDEVYVQLHGYNLIPKEFSMDTYKFLIGNKGAMLLKAFGVTTLVTVLGTLYQVTLTTLLAYATTQRKEQFRFARPLSFFAWFTTVFSGGVVPWYILCTQYYGLKNNIWALFIPYGVNVFNMFIVRGSFREVPYEIIESAKIDGASDSRIFWNIAIPLARGGILTIALFTIFALWNDFYLPQWLITDANLFTLQKILYSMLSNVASLLHGSDITVLSEITIPAETAKMAVAVMAILPLCLIYPFALKYFVKGINVGGVKG